jgi:hypothetical protein
MNVKAIAIAFGMYVLTGCASQSAYQKGLADGQKLVQEKKESASTKVEELEDSALAEVKAKATEYEAQLEAYAADLAARAKAEAQTLAESAKAELRAQAAVEADKLARWLEEEHKSLSASEPKKK